MRGMSADTTPAPWTLDYDWQMGHDVHGTTYPLHAIVTPASAVPAAYAPVADGASAGVSARLDGDVIVLESAGEDACEALTDASERMVAALADTNPQATITWEPQAPYASADGRPAQRIDGYWIAADRADTYAADRDVAVELVREAAPDLDEVRVETRDGRAVLVGRVNGHEGLEMYIAPPQIDIIREDAASGELAAFIDEIREG